MAGKLGTFPGRRSGKNNSQCYWLFNFKHLQNVLTIYVQFLFCFLYIKMYMYVYQLQEYPFIHIQKYISLINHTTNRHIFNHCGVELFATIFRSSQAGIADAISSSK